MTRPELLNEQETVEIIDFLRHIRDTPRDEIDPPDVSKSAAAKFLALLKWDDNHKDKL